MPRRSVWRSPLSLHAGLMWVIARAVSRRGSGAWVTRSGSSVSALRRTPALIHSRAGFSWRGGAALCGRDWIDFLTRCKAVLGSESGSSVFDATGAIERSVLRHELAEPGTPFE